MPPTQNAPFQGWAHRLYDLVTEMETFYGDQPAKLENLTRYAWEEADACMRRARADAHLGVRDVG